MIFVATNKVPHFGQTTEALSIVVIQLPSWRMIDAKYTLQLRLTILFAFEYPKQKFTGSSETVTENIVNF